VLQGCKEEKGDNLWTVSANEEESKEEANNVYVGPQIGMNPISVWGLPNLEY
jgi:hypothetical protein